MSIEAQSAQEATEVPAPLGARGDAIRFLAELSRVYRSQPQTNLEALAFTAVPRFADVCIVDLFGDSEPDLRVAVIHGRPRESAALQALRCESRSLLPVLLCDAARARPAELGTSPEEARMLHELGVSSIIRVPLLSHGRKVGLATFAVCGRDERYGEEEVAVARAAATMAAMDVQLVREERRCARVLESRDEAVAMTAHEINTPVTLLAVLIDRLQMVVHDDRVVRTVGRMKDAVRHLDQLLVGILDASRFEHGGVQLRRTYVEVGTLLAQVVTSIEQAHGERGCRVRLHGAWPIAGELDALKMEQLFTNLISNAVKYGDGKPIDVMVDRRGSVLHFRVQDQGIGIPEEALGRLCQPFQRAAGQNYRGLGLGLYICKQIVEAHHGTLSVSSVEGEGTTVTVELPLT